MAEGVEARTTVPIIIMVVVSVLVAQMHLVMAGRGPEITPTIITPNRRLGMIKGVNKLVILIITASLILRWLSRNA